MKLVLILRIVAVVIFLAGVLFEAFVLGVNHPGLFIDGTDIAILLILVSALLEYRERRKKN